MNIAHDFSVEELLSETFSKRTNNILLIARSLQKYIVAIRRELHMFPELGWEEKKTLAIIKREIEHYQKQFNDSLSISYKEGGIWVDLIVDKSRETRLFRADIDALPIEEKTNLSYASRNKGVMHACGHDCHAAMLLGAYKACAEGLIRPNYNIRFVWQRAEEYVKKESGAECLVKEGVCNGVNEAFGLHIQSTMLNSAFFATSGSMMANSSHIEFSIECSGGHVMRPDLGSNAIYIMTDIQNTLRGFEGLFFQADEPIAFVPSIASAGVAANIRPNQASMAFAIRNFLPKNKRDEFVKAIKQKILTIVESYPTANLASFTFDEGYPSLKNTRSSYNKVKTALKNQKLEVLEMNPIFAGEDFSYYLQKVPGSFWCLGAKKGEGWDHHTPRFNPDENVLWLGVAYWLALAIK